MAEKQSIINITVNSSANGLKEELESQARNYGLTTRTLVAKIYTYAVSHQDKFSEPLESARGKPGDHIGTTVSDEVGAKLKTWAKERNTPRGVHCCFILEKALQGNSLREMVR